MADAPIKDPPPSIRDLDETLRSIDGFLRWIVIDAALLREQFQRPFGSLYERDIHRRIGIALGQLEDVDSEDHILYRNLDLFGLTGASLELKLQIGRALGEELLSSAANVHAVARTPPRILGVSLEPLLRWVNMLLGSLSKALPVLEAVKEYKEGVELTIDHQATAPMPDRRIFPGLR